MITFDIRLSKMDDVRRFKGNEPQHHSGQQGNDGQNPKQPADFFDFHRENQQQRKNRRSPQK